MVSKDCVFEETTVELDLKKFFAWFKHKMFMAEEEIPLSYNFKIMGKLIQYVKNNIQGNTQMKLVSE